MSFGEQGDQFRKRVHTNRGPMYIEPHEAPMLYPPKVPGFWRRTLNRLADNIIGLALPAGVGLLIEGWTGDQYGWLAAGVVVLYLYDKWS